MSLATPDSIRTLQRKLYLKAKAEPGFRFYLLYDKVCWPSPAFTDSVTRLKQPPGTPPSSALV
jgi:hypothetical protein